MSVTPGDRTLLGGDFGDCGEHPSRNRGEQLDTVQSRDAFNEPEGSHRFHTDVRHGRERNPPGPPMSDDPFPRRDYRSRPVGDSIGYVTRVALKKDTKIELVRSIPLFAQFSKSDLQTIARIAEEIEFEPGALLMREGETGHEVFVIVSGQLEVWRRGAGGKIADRGPGEVVGEMALISKKPRNASVRAATPVHLLRIKDTDFTGATRPAARTLAQDRERACRPRTGGARTALSRLTRASKAVTKKGGLCSP